MAWAVLYLSNSPWFGEQWLEQQAEIFVETDRSGREALSPSPCASCVFSPCETPDTPSVEEFKHLIPNRAVFALGVFLIELCIDRPLRQATWASVGPSQQTTSVLEDYSIALGKLDDVRGLAGDSYGDAAERCVKFCFEGRDQYKTFDFAQFRQQFYDAVVAPVQATYLLFPESRVHLPD